MREVATSSIALRSSNIMDEATRGLLSQAIRDAFTSSSIDHNEEYIDSLISKVDNDILQAHLASQDGNARETPLRTSGSVLRTPPASPPKGRGSSRLLNAQKRDYANLTGAESRKKRKRQIPQRSEKCADEPSLGCTAAEGTIEVGPQCSNHETLSDSEYVKDSRPLNLPANEFSSYQPDTAFTMNAMASILFECFVVNSAIARYGHQTSMAPTRTDPDKIRKYVDEIAEYDYKQAVSIIQRDNALAVGKGLQNRYNETIFWKIILKGAALIDHTKLPSAKGPADGFTVAEKAATRKFMEDAGYGLSAQNQRHCRNFWKNLFKMREVGIEKALYYRTKEFDSYCKGYPKTSEISLVDAILRWETKYRPHIEQLETRALRIGKGDYARLCDLENPEVIERLKVRESSWNNGRNDWASLGEEESFKATGQLVFPPDAICAPFENHSVSEFGADKSAFTFLLPKDDTFLFVCSIVPVREGDFLGIFAGHIRFSTDVSVTHGIRGPVDNLWLDYSQVTETRTSWRVSVKATKSIMPFDPLVRVAAKQEQFMLHSSPENATRGFLVPCQTD
ncbi:hypothetical protein PMG11_11116 [Penicillium brasilianum]|uniref:Uncharacterized protein n=1 Tax=Penicillium brasilianum TaxID=104259 RepID=A0A0F7U105_PENBI|nr:hypothetical protein PMG11_11116 [Penicillium brasilianum]